MSFGKGYSVKIVLTSVAIGAATGAYLVDGSIARYALAVVAILALVLLFFPLIIELIDKLIGK